MLIRIVAMLAIGVTAINANEPQAVAAVLISEASGEGEDGMRAVMEVIQNRARHRHEAWFEAAKARKQFSALNHTTITELIANAKNHRLWDRAMFIAAHGTRTNLTGGADHYHESTIRPYWADRTKMTTRIGKHVFYRLDDRRK